MMEREGSGSASAEAGVAAWRKTGVYTRTRAHELEIAQNQKKLLKSVFGVL